MNTFSPLFLLAALGVLSATATSALAAADTSKWKCETCPFEKAGRSGSLDIGIGTVTEDSAKFGDYTGLDQKGPYLVLGGEARYRGTAGEFGSVSASDLGLDIRTIAAEYGQEGKYSLRLGYAEIPRHFSDTAMTPYLGNGGAALSLPAGFPAASTALMPLAGTLQPVELGFKHSRLDAAGSWIAGPNWNHRLSLRHDARDGTRPIASSFFANAANLAAPLDQTTDQIEASTSYVTPQLQLMLAYQGSLFRNGLQSLTWANPFTPSVAGSGRGQLALAPDNQFHQIIGTASYAITPQIRASGDIAFGRMTQDAPYLAATLNPTLAVPALPAQSLDARVDTFNASARVTAALADNLRLNGSYVRNVRDNRTASLAYPAVSTDMFLGSTLRSNQPFSFTQDRLKLSADYRGPGSLKASAGADQDNIERSLQEVVTTRETTLWARASARGLDKLSLEFKLAHGERDHSSYGVATWVSPPENGLMRKYYLAARSRNTAGVRADAALAENVSLGLHADWADDDYSESTVGLTDARSASYGADLSVAISAETQLHAFAQGEQIESRQAGSQAFASPDWWAHNKDQVSLFGLGIKHLAMKGKLELGADMTFSRTRSDVTMDIVTASPAFPTATTSMDSLKLHATYHLQDKLSVVGTWWYEHYESQDWRLDGVQPATIPNLLAFGAQSPRYNVNAVSVALRYKF